MRSIEEPSGLEDWECGVDTTRLLQCLGGRMSRSILMALLIQSKALKMRMMTVLIKKKCFRREREFPGRLLQASNVGN